MRLPLIAPAELSPEQRPVYDSMRTGIEQNFAGFKSIADNGALMGPWNPWLHEAEIRQADLGPDLSAVGVARAAAQCPGSRDPGHRHDLPFRLRALRPRHRGRASRPFRR
jgi:hypothetical protein